MINTEVDASNRIDQDTAAPFLFTLDEFTDCADQKHPFPITSHSPAFGSSQIPPYKGDEDETPPPLKGKQNTLSPWLTQQIINYLKKER